MSYYIFVRDAEFLCSEAEDAFTKDNHQGARRCATASVLFSFMAVESFINNMMSDFTSLPEGLFSEHELGFLTEQTVEFSEAGPEAGRFRLTNRRQYRSLEAKIMFLVARFGSDVVDKGSTLWQKFVQAKDVRDRLTHPRKGGASVPTPTEASETLEVVKKIIQLVAMKVWGKSVQF